MKEFLQYYFKRPLRDDGHGKMWFTLNYLWTFGSLFFIGIFIKGAIKYESPLIWTATLFPIIMLAYNIADEYYAFQFQKTGTRKVTAKILMNIAKYSCTAVMLYLIIRTFITG